MGQSWVMLIVVAAVDCSYKFPSWSRYTWIPLEKAKRMDDKLVLKGLSTCKVPFSYVNIFSQYPSPISHMR